MSFNIFIDRHTVCLSCILEKFHTKFHSTYFKLNNEDKTGVFYSILESKTVTYDIGKQ